MNGEIGIRPRDLILSPLFQQASPETRVRVIEKIISGNESQDPFFKTFSLKSPEEKIGIVERMTSEKVMQLSKGIEESERRQESIGPTPEIRPFGLVGPSVTEPTFRKMASFLPFAGGAAGAAAGGAASVEAGELGGVAPIAGAYFGGMGGKSLESIFLRLAGLEPPVEETQALTPAGQELKQIEAGGKEQAEIQAAAELIGPAFTRLSGPFRSSAEKSIERVLGATKEKMKATATEKVVPGMLERKLTATSRRSLLETAQSRVKEFSQAVSEEARLADQTGKTVNVNSLVEKLESLKENFIVRSQTGEKITGNVQAISQLTGMQNVLKKYGETILPTDLVNLRRFWDKEVARSQLGFLLSPETRISSITSAPIEAERAATNAIRDTLNKEFPAFKEVNSQYSFWRDLQTVLGATMQRTASQSGIVGKVLHRAGAAGAGATVGGIVGGREGAEKGFLVGAALGVLMDSTAWKTVSAVNKDRIAKFLASGQLHKVDNLARVLLAASKKTGREDEN